METEEVEHDDDLSDHPEISVIPVRLVGPYENLHQPPNHSTIIRGKYYKQTYRPAWEQMPDFVGWLRGVEGEPTRAYCTYCQKTLHAHRLSLLKHTCTIRHQKAAQMHGNLKNKVMEQGVLLHDSALHHEDLEEGEETIEYADTTEMDDQDTENDPDEDDDDGESPQLQQRTSFHKHQGNQVLNQPPISTQIIDNTRGVPITGLQVSLYKLIDGRWTYINEGVTNASGRFAQFLDRSLFTPGRYKLHYDVDRYFEGRKQEYLYPFIEIVFDSSGPNEHYHIPVLLGPFGYTTYRG